MKLIIIFSLFLFVLTSQLAASYNSNQQQITEKDLGYKIIDLFTFIDEDFTLERAADDLHAARLLLVDQGYDVPLLSEMFEKTLRSMELQGVFLDSDFLEDFYTLVFSKEYGKVKDVSHSIFYDKDVRKTALQTKSQKKKKGLQVPNGVAIGFCKALAGGLLCIIPSGSHTGNRYRASLSRD